MFTFYSLLQASPKLKFNEELLRHLGQRIDREEPTDTVFDEVQARVSQLLLLCPLGFPHYILRMMSPPMSWNCIRQEKKKPLSTPVLMHSGLLSIAFCLSVCDWTIIHWTKIQTRK